MSHEKEPHKGVENQRDSYKLTSALSKALDEKLDEKNKSEIDRLGIVTPDSETRVIFGPVTIDKKTNTLIDALKKMGFNSKEQRAILGWACMVKYNISDSKLGDVLSINNKKFLIIERAKQKPVYISLGAKIKDLLPRSNDRNIVLFPPNEHVEKTRRAWEALRAENLHEFDTKSVYEKGNLYDVMLHEGLAVTRKRKIELWTEMQLQIQREANGDAASRGFLEMLKRDKPVLKKLSAESFDQPYRGTALQHMAMIAYLQRGHAEKIVEEDAKEIEARREKEYQIEVKGYRELIKKELPLSTGWESTSGSQQIIFHASAGRDVEVDINFFPDEEGHLRAGIKRGEKSEGTARAKTFGELIIILKPLLGDAVEAAKKEWIANISKVSNTLLGDWSRQVTFDHESGTYRVTMYGPTPHGTPYTFNIRIPDNADPRYGTIVDTQLINRGMVEDIYFESPEEFRRELTENVIKPNETLLKEAEKNANTLTGMMGKNGYSIVEVNYTVRPPRIEFRYTGKKDEYTVRIDLVKSAAIKDSLFRAYIGTKNIKRYDHVNEPTIPKLVNAINYQRDIVERRISQ